MIRDIKLTFGSDPECFIKTKQGIIIGSEELIPENGITTDFGSIVRDGIQVELHPNPADNAEEFVRNVTELKKTFEELCDSKNLEPCYDQVVEITPEIMEGLSKKSKTFGCVPSMNAYKDDIDLPKDASKIMFRSGGGHIHIGGKDNYSSDFIRNNAEDIIKTLDATLGVYLTQKESIDDIKKRRKYYGRAGEYRMPTYGLEYRVPSNIWLTQLDLVPTMLYMVSSAVSIIFANDLIDYELKTDNSTKDFINQE